MNPQTHLYLSVGSRSLLHREKITMDYVKNLLLQGIFFDDESNEKSEATALAVKGKSKPNLNKSKNYRCFECGSRSHLIKMCLKRKNKFKNGNDDGAVSLLTTMLVQSDTNPTDWYVDSGCTSHLSKHKSILFDTEEPEQKGVMCANSNKISVGCVGKVKQRIINTEKNNKQTEIVINNVHYVPNIVANLLSVSQMATIDHSVLFTRKGCKIFDSDWNVVATASLVNGLYKLDVAHDTKSLLVSSEKNSIHKPKENLILWHLFGHANFGYLKFLKDKIKNISFTEDA